MPPRAAWLTQLSQIVSTLTVLECPVVDRALCEKLFGVKRRRAIEVMQQFGGYRSGNTLLLDRVALIRKLRELQDSPQAVGEFKRKEKLAAKLDELHRIQAAKRVKIRTNDRVHDPMLRDLSPDILLKPGMLAISFTEAEDLFSKLYELSQVTVNEFDRVCEAVQARDE